MFLLSVANGGCEYFAIPTNPVHRRRTAQQALGTDFTPSRKTKTPQKKEERTTMEDQVPTDIARPAFFMPYIPAIAPGTQKIPDTIPHGVNFPSTPRSGIASQDVMKQKNVL
mmetsp:Transcript_29363/g.42611  ORF Transcript_29363/g.42611 Transcript_29363/m.42611 type:complete len:112 (-) Transcript_29363:264-599(-)